MALFQSTSNVIDTEAGLNGLIGLRDLPLSRPRTDESSTGRHSSVCTQVVWILFWLSILLIVAYPIAILAAFFYVILNPLSLINCVKPLSELLFTAINLPLVCAQNMADAKQLIVM